MPLLKTNLSDLFGSCVIILTKILSKSHVLSSYIVKRFYSYNYLLEMRLFKKAYSTSVNYQIHLVLNLHLWADQFKFIS